MSEVIFAFIVAPFFIYYVVLIIKFFEDDYENDRKELIKDLIPVYGLLRHIKKKWDATK